MLVVFFSFDFSAMATKSVTAMQSWPVSSAAVYMCTARAVYTTVSYAWALAQCRPDPHSSRPRTVASGFNLLHNSRSCGGKLSVVKMWNIPTLHNFVPVRNQQAQFRFGEKLLWWRIKFWWDDVVRLCSCQQFPSSASCCIVDIWLVSRQSFSDQNHECILSRVWETERKLDSERWTVAGPRLPCHSVKCLLSPETSLQLCLEKAKGGLWSERKNSDIKISCTQSNIQWILM